MFGKCVELCACHFNFLELEFFICTQKERIGLEVLNLGTFVKVEITQGSPRPIKAVLLVGHKVTGLEVYIF